MSKPHVIRLREPWQRELLAPVEAGDDVARTLRCTRRFNAPTNLDADERVWLVCDAVDSRASFAINGRSLGAIEGHRPQPRIDITEALRPANVLVIDIDVDPRLQGATGILPVQGSSATRTGDTPVAFGEVPPGEAEPMGLPGGIGEVRLEIGRHAPDWRIEELDPR